MSPNFTRSSMIVALLAFVLLPLSAVAGVPAAPASTVWGQPNFTSNIANNGGVSASSLNGPAGITTDAAGNLYVAENGNHRILRYPNSNGVIGTTADRVWGQPDFTSNTVNNGGRSASSLYGPSDVSFDAAGNLYTVDYNNSRVLRYPNSNGVIATTADRVWGQANFTTGTANNGGRSASSLYLPIGLSFDAGGNMYVADSYNSRVLRYPNSNGVIATTADRVWGQADFTAGTANNGGISASSLSQPAGILFDAEGSMYVADSYNNRVLRYPNSNGVIATTADWVRGQPNFTSGTANNGGISAASLSWPMGLTFDVAGRLIVGQLQNRRLVAPVPHFPPRLTQPLDQRVFYNETATLSVTVTSTEPLTYQWYQGQKGDTSTLLGNTATVTTNALTASTDYWVRVSDGANEVDSETIRVVVSPVRATYVPTSDTFALENLTSDAVTVDVTITPSSFFPLTLPGRTQRFFERGGGTLAIAADSETLAELAAGTAALEQHLCSTRPATIWTGHPASTRYVPDNTWSFSGTGTADVIVGSSGDDTINGWGGDDVICGGRGNDTITGHDGADWLNGNGGNDTLDGGANNDRLFGGIGRDTLNGEDGADTLLVDGADVTVTGGSGIDTIAGLSSPTAISLDLGLNGLERAFGSPGNDTFTSSILPDSAPGVMVVGGAGDDDITGSPGSDQLFGETGNDILRGEGGADMLRGGNGNDTLQGGADNDRIFGEAGADALTGEAGNDSLYPDGDDTLVQGGANLDIVSGGYASSLTLDLGLNGIERAYGSPGNDTFTSSTLPDSAPGVMVVGGAGDDDITGSSGPDLLLGATGNDILRGEGGDDRLYGGAGVDAFSGGAGIDRIFDFSVADGDSKDATIP